MRSVTALPMPIGAYLVDEFDARFDLAPLTRSHSSDQVHRLAIG
ncbi:MAG TPA: hypothetical protein VF534_01790 [Paraburkholderia sp.]